MNKTHFLLLVDSAKTRFNSASSSKRNRNFVLEVVRTFATFLHSNFFEHAGAVSVRHNLHDYSCIFYCFRTYTGTTMIMATVK